MMRKLKEMIAGAICLIDHEYHNGKKGVGTDKYYSEEAHAAMSEIADAAENLGDQLLMDMTEGWSAKQGLYQFAKQLRDE